MQTVGLTGGIGSGKSLVANIFIHLGIPVFNADIESRKILDEDPQIHYQLSDWFGPSIFKDGRVDRTILAGIIFSNPAILSRMNELIHPKVMDRFIIWCRDYQNKPYVIHEAAILFESGFFKQMSTTILVIAPEEIRIKRAKQRDKTPEESIRQRMRNQWSDEKKAPLAGFIIQNDEKTPLIPRVLEIHNKLTV